MRKSFFICLLSVLLGGCVSSHSRRHSFASLHQRVEQMLAGRCHCGPLISDELLGRFFEVVPHNSGCRVLLFERQFFSQRDWERQHASLTNRVTQFLTKTNQTREEAAIGVAAIEQMHKLPGWRYGRIGVDIQLQTPEVVYPGMEKDQAKAQRVFDEIAGLMKPYRADSL